MNISSTLSLFVAVLMFTTHTAYADNMQGMGNMNTQQTTGNAAAKVHQGHGVVNKINLDTGKINITHEAIASLKWPAMTMDFDAQNKADLAALKPGMKVDFDLANFGKGYRITRIAPVK